MLHFVAKEKIEVNRNKSICEVNSRCGPKYFVKNSIVCVVSRQLRALEHIYRYKLAMSLVTNDEIVLCKAFQYFLKEDIKVVYHMKVKYYRFMAYIIKAFS